MIVKQVSSKGKGSFGGLAEYILDEKNNMEKVEYYEFSNCPYSEVDGNLEYIKQMQNLNQVLSGDKTMHLIVSFQEEEKPTKEVLRDIEKELLKSIGMENHHRLSATHTNTNNFHLHIAINRINPENNLLVDPWKSKMKLQKKAKELEKKYNLKIDNHDPTWTKEQLQSDIKDNEVHSGVKSFLSWVKENILEDIKEVLDNPKSTLEDLHSTLGKYNLELKTRGNGVIIADKTRKLFVKASDVHRTLSKNSLEKKFGKFENPKTHTKPVKQFTNPTSKLWKEYQNLMSQRKVTKKNLLELEKISRLEIKDSLTLKYSEQLREIRNNSTLSREVKYQYKLVIYANKRIEFDNLKEVFSKKRRDIHKDNKLFSYKEFLLEKALNGDKLSLEALRNTKMKFKPDENILRDPNGKINHKIWQSVKAKITKQGNVVYQVGKDSKIIDKGDHLKLSLQNNDKAILMALQMAKAMYGDTLDVKGDIAFKKHILMVSERYNLKLNFSNPVMKKIVTQNRQEKAKQSIGKSR